MASKQCLVMGKEKISLMCHPEILPVIKTTRSMFLAQIKNTAGTIDGEDTLNINIVVTYNHTSSEMWPIWNAHT